MKLDRRKIKEIASLDDNELWNTIKEMASKQGLVLPEKTPHHNELEKLRVIMLSDKINPIVAMKILNDIKRGKWNG